MSSLQVEFQHQFIQAMQPVIDRLIRNAVATRPPELTEQHAVDFAVVMAISSLTSVIADTVQRYGRPLNAPQALDDETRQKCSDMILAILTAIRQRFPALPAASRTIVQEVEFPKAN